MQAHQINTNVLSAILIYMSKVSTVKIYANLRICNCKTCGRFRIENWHDRTRAQTSQAQAVPSNYCSLETGAKIRLWFVGVLKLLDLVIKGLNQ